MRERVVRDNVVAKQAQIMRARDNTRDIMYKRAGFNRA